MKEFWVVAGDVTASSAALVSRCRELAEQKGLPPKLLLIKNTSPLCVRSTVEALTERCLRDRPEAIIFECDRFFGDVAPAFAYAVGKGVTADCTALEWDDTFGLLQIRPTFGGRKIAVNRSIEKPYIATVRVGAFGKAAFDGTGIVVEELSVSESESPIKLLDHLSHHDKSTPLETYDVILSGGAGLGSRERFQRLGQLAEHLGAGLGASRAAVAAGFADYSYQVGQTGVSVHPKLYVAFGISGAVQHLSGILGAKKIVAVNNDPKAPIHEYADYSLIADCGEVIERLLQVYS